MKERRHLTKKQVIFHKDNSPAYKSLATMVKTHELKFELLSNQLHSPDLTPNNFHLPNHKKLRGEMNWIF